MKKTPVSSLASGAAILAGGLLFTGPARAAVVFSENFEGGANAFSMPTYAYSQNYTLPNGLTPGGDQRYAFGASGGPNTFPGGDHSLLTGGISAAQIDAGLVNYNFYAQFSTYLDQTDFGQLSVQFLDGSNSPIGAPVLIGSEAFINSLPRGSNGTFGNAAAWGEQNAAGQVPLLARTLSVAILETKQVGVGNVIDGYMDNVVLNITVVPEPGTVALSGLTGLALLRRRRRA